MKSPCTNCTARNIPCSAKDKTYRDGRPAQGEDVFPISPRRKPPYGLPDDDRMTAQDALYLEYFDFNFIRGNTERVDLRYVARSGDEWFVPFTGSSL